MLRLLTCLALAVQPLAGCATPPAGERLAVSSLGCMQASVRQKVPAGLPQGELHCMAAGMIARYCSAPEAHLAGLGKELRDLLGAGDPQWSDVAQNRRGIACARGAGTDAELLECCGARLSAPARSPGPSPRPLPPRDR